MIQITDIDVADAAALTRQLAAIGAPTGEEDRRATFVLNWLRSAGMPQAYQDGAGNVLARLGPADQPLLLLDAHLDTVFPDHALEVRETGDGLWHCPGIFDNTATCALLMIYARCVARQPGAAPMLLSFTVGEEGEGDLRGIRHVIDHGEEKPAAAVVFDLDAGTFSRQCVGSTRWRIGFEAEGGHSWHHFGRPSALHAACRWAASLESLMPWRAYELTYNVGRLTGGHSINAIAGDASLWLDLRAIDPDELVEAEQQILGSLHRIEDIRVTAEGIGRRPAASLPEDHPLITAVRRAHIAVNVPLQEHACSTNANWPAHRGIPCVCVGLLTGANIHTRAEYLDPTSIGPGLVLLEAIIDVVAIVCQDKPGRYETIEPQ